MSTFLIFVVILCCVSQAIFPVTSLSIDGSSDEVSSSDGQTEKGQGGKYNSNMLRDSNGIYTIKVFGLESFEVLCDADLAGPGWTVIASRSNIELNFFRNWAEYKRGFGNLTGDFFIGLDKLHAITVSQPHELYIYLEDFEGNKRFARYDEFLIGTETDKYVMAKLGTYVGDMGDSLTYHAKMKFTTYDSDNDSSGSNCAVERMGAWWYNDCTYSGSNGNYTIKVFGLEPFEVLCDSDLAGPGWTVIASRSNIELNFFRNWAEYKRGFGNLTGDFFIGLDKLHAITVSQPHELYIYLEDFEGNKRFARYDEFQIGNETDKYAMSKLGTYVGDMGDSLRAHVNKKFTTYDSDNDDDANKNCAITNMGAWWYGCDVYSNLFGLYLNGAHANTLDYKGICWYLWGKAAYSYKVMRMMVKPKCSCSQ
ncbi:hypothetical protein ACLKA6_013716 [Drosophila palustris]